jgi:hypothetical protein
MQITYNDRRNWVGERYDKSRLGEQRALLAPAHTPDNRWEGEIDRPSPGLRHRTRLDNKCWFSRKSYIQCLSVEQAIELYPDYMKWIFINTSINWSVHVIRKMRSLIGSVSSKQDIMACLSN